MSVICSTHLIIPTSLHNHKDDLLDNIHKYNPLILCLSETCVNNELNISVVCRHISEVSENFKY